MTHNPGFPGLCGFYITTQDEGEKHMSRSQMFWYGNMAGAIVGWLFIFVGAAVHLQGELQTLWLIIAVLWGLGHPLELAMAVPIAKKAGFSPLKTVASTLIFGITWWIPVKLGVFKP